MQWPAIVYLVNLAAAWFMTGLIWFVQVVHYPQFCDVGADAFKNYHARHTKLTTRIVAGPMLIELTAAAALLAIRPDQISVSIPAISFALVLIAWCSTAFLQVPRHNHLRNGFDSRTCKLLVATNWIRTFAWTARALLLSTAASILLSA